MIKNINIIMDKFNFKDYRNLIRTDELADSLSTYEGTIPMFLKPFVNHEQYITTLKGSEQYEEIRKEYLSIRREFLQAQDKDEYRRNELENWLDKNPQFMSILNNAVSSTK